MTFRYSTLPKNDSVGDAYLQLNVGRWKKDFVSKGNNEVLPNESLSLDYARHSLCTRTLVLETLFLKLERKRMSLHMVQNAMYRCHGNC